MDSVTRIPIPTPPGDGQRWFLVHAADGSGYWWVREDHDGFRPPRRPVPCIDASTSYGTSTGTGTGGVLTATAVAPVPERTAVDVHRFGRGT